MSEVVQVPGEHYQQNRHQGIYSRRKGGVIIEVDYKTTTYDDFPVIERDSGSRFGVTALLTALVVVLYFYDELSHFNVQLIESLI